MKNGIMLMLLVGGTLLQGCGEEWKAEDLDVLIILHQNPMMERGLAEAAAKDKEVVQAARAQHAKELGERLEADQKGEVDRLLKGRVAELQAQIKSLEEKVATLEAAASQPPAPATDAKKASK